MHKHPDAAFLQNACIPSFRAPRGLRPGLVCVALVGAVLRYRLAALGPNREWHPSI